MISNVCSWNNMRENEERQTDRQSYTCTHGEFDFNEFCLLSSFEQINSNK